MRTSTAGLFFIVAFSLPLRSSSQDPGGTQPSWLDRIGSPEAFASIAAPEQTRPEFSKVTKYMVPVRDDPALLGPVFQNLNVYQFHYLFLRTEFPERFGTLGPLEYHRMIYQRDGREYFSGYVYEMAIADGTGGYAFDVITHSGDETELPTLDEIRWIHEQLSGVVAMTPLFYAPSERNALARARTWSAAGFPIYLSGSTEQTEYEAYSKAANYGRIRVMTLAEFDAAAAAGDLSWQDLLVLEACPVDIEGVVAGVITGTRQGEFSHVNLRSIQRGTPNAFVREATRVFGAYEGQLVKLSVGSDRYTVETGVREQEAAAFWAGHRPLLGNLSFPDDDYGELDALEQLAQAAGADDRLANRFGSKAAGLARLHTCLEPAYRVAGFAIPFSHQTRFMRSNRIPCTRGDVLALVTYEEYVGTLLADPLFRTNPSYRARHLAYLREYARDHGRVDPAVVQRIASRIVGVFGTTKRNVRFRSSSNAEDLPGFNGAGLYDSTSVCAEDSLDDDEAGPCRCDPWTGNERSIERGLIRVWMSLWNFRAFEEREYYQIPHDRARMGVLVSEAFPDEAANGVLLTGDPVTGDRSYYVNVQMGDVSVVLPDPGVVPEKNRLLMEHGRVKEIQRISPSSIVPQGTVVLADGQLGLLGQVMARVDRDFPVYLEGYARDQVLLDVEFKFTRDARLTLKQCRTLLRNDAKRRTREDYDALAIPANLALVPLNSSPELLIRLHSGTVFLPHDLERFCVELVHSVETQDGQQAEPASAGLFVKHASGGYRFEQRFRLGDRLLTLETGAIRPEGEGSPNVLLPIEGEIRFAEEGAVLPVNSVFRSAAEQERLQPAGGIPSQVVAREALGAQTVRPNAVIVNEYWVFDNGTSYESLGWRPLYGSWVELLVADPAGVDLRGWRITNRERVGGREFDDPRYGSLVFPDLEQFAHVAWGTCILLIPHLCAENAAAFPVDDLDSADGSMVLYVGNGNLDCVSDPGFTIGRGDECIALLAPGGTGAPEAELLVDFVAEGNRVTPRAFAGQTAVVFDNPFVGIGVDDGAFFTHSPDGGLNNDDGSDRNDRDALPGPGGWVVDPPRMYTGDHRAYPWWNVLTPGRPNTGQRVRQRP